MIVRRKDGLYVVSEKTGKSLGGPYKTKSEASHRLKQVEYFKKHGEDSNFLSSAAGGALGTGAVLGAGYLVAKNKLIKGARTAGKVGLVASILGGTAMAASKLTGAKGVRLMKNLGVNKETRRAVSNIFSKKANYDVIGSAPAEQFGTGVIFKAIEQANKNNYSEAGGHAANIHQSILSALDSYGEFKLHGGVNYNVNK